MIAVCAHAYQMAQREEHTRRKISLTLLDRQSAFFGFFTPSLRGAVKTQHYSYMRRTKCSPAIRPENGAGRHVARFSISETQTTFTAAYGRPANADLRFAVLGFPKI